MTAVAVGGPRPSITAVLYKQITDSKHAFTAARARKMDAVTDQQRRDAITAIDVALDRYNELCAGRP